MPLYNDNLHKLRIKKTSFKELQKDQRKRATRKPLSIQKHEQSKRSAVQRASQTRY